MISPTDTDFNSELVRRAKCGCVESFEELVRNHHLQLRRFLAQRIADLATVDDIAQDVFVIAMEKLGDLKEDAAFMGWLMSIAKNKCVDHIRKLARHQRTPNEKLDYLVAQQQARNATHEDLELQERVTQVLHQCIAKLTPQAQELVRQFYFENQTAASIADDRNQKSSSVRMSLLRIRKSLANCIKKNTGGER